LRNLKKRQASIMPAPLFYKFNNFSSRFSIKPIYSRADVNPIVFPPIEKGEGADQQPILG